MTLSTYLLYLLAVTLLVITPSPAMLMTLTNSVNHGPWRALASLAGALTANFAIMMCGGLFATLGSLLLLARRHA